MYLCVPVMLCHVCIGAETLCSHADFFFLLLFADSSFVLTHYKTEQCRRPPRLCRQGYACPFFHNNKDRRRSPKCYKYRWAKKKATNFLFGGCSTVLCSSMHHIKKKKRSTPCPNVKLNDEWGDFVNCEQGDSCCYCHTRTEQQFHPEVGWPAVV